MKQSMTPETDGGSLRSCEEDARNFQDAAGRLDAW